MPSITLQETAGLSAAFFDSNPLPSFVVHAHSLKIEAANKKALSLFQFSQQHLQSLCFVDLIALDDKLLFHQMWQQQHGAAEWSNVFALMGNRGQAFIFNLLLVPFSDGPDNYCQVLCMQASENGTGDECECGELDLKQTIILPSHQEDKVKLLSRLVKETPDILNASDLDYKPLTWNQAAERIYGIASEQAIGADLRRFIKIEYPGTTREAVRHKIDTEGHWRGEMLITRPADNKKVYVLASFKKLYNEAQHHIGYVVSGIDITERKEDELKLKEMENRFSELADAAPVGIWMSDAANKLIYVNRTLLYHTGLNTEDFTAEYWRSRVHPNDIEQTKADFDVHFAAKQPVTLAYRMKTMSGQYCWVQDTGTPRFLEDGTFLGYIGSVVDINDTKIREAQLQYQASVLENVQDIIVTTDLDFKVHTWNKIAESVYDYTRTQAVGHNLFELVQFDFLSSSREAAIQELAENGTWKGEVIFVDRKGEKRYFLHSVTYFINEQGLPNGIIAVGREVTDRKKAAEKLQQSELFYRSLIADSLDGIILSDVTGTITFVAPSVKHILGYDSQEVVGQNCFAFVHPDDIAWAFESFEREVMANPQIKSIVVRLKKKDGSWLWCMVRGHNLLSNPNIKGVVIYFHDDSMRKQASEALKESEKRFRNLISDLQVGVILSGPDAKTIMCNKNICNMLMVSEEEFIGKNVYDVLTDDFVYEDGRYMPVEKRPLSRALRTKKNVKDVVLGFRQRTTNERMWVLINTDPVVDEKGTLIHIISTIKDITDRKKLEEELLAEQIGHQKALTQATLDGQEKERREIGKELHDNVGQQLTTTKLFLDMAKTTADDATAEMVSLALKGISDVINEVRSISHALVPPTLGDLGIIESIEELIETIRYVQLLKIDFNYFDLNEDRIPENQQLMLYRIIQEGLSNIVKHANAREVSIVMKNNNKQLMLEIKDNGKGFDLATVRRGLGLTNIRNRAELFGGKVTLNSTPGGGCSLKVVIPDKALSATL